MTDLARTSDAALHAFIRQHSDYQIDAAQPAYRGGTNRVTFGRLGERPVVFKYFVTADRFANELACLRHFAATGLVPEVLASEDRLIVMSRLAGDGLHAARPEQAITLSEQIGDALGRLASVPLREPGAEDAAVPEFRAILWGPSVREALDAYLRRCRRILSILPDDGAFYRESLNRIERLADRVANESPILFHEDVSNLTVHDGVFVGFYDLEMCRLGTASMQLGVALNLCVAGPLSWPRVWSGFTRRLGGTWSEEDSLAALAMHHFYHWIRICRWGLWDGDPQAQHHREPAIAYATRHRAQMHAAQRLVEERAAAR